MLIVFVDCKEPKEPLPLVTGFVPAPTTKAVLLPKLAPITWFAEVRSAFALYTVGVAVPAPVMVILPPVPTALPDCAAKVEVPNGFGDAPDSEL
jgi:hypothetical protein